jgi:hypothetical protein
MGEMAHTLIELGLGLLVSVVGWLVNRSIRHMDESVKGVALSVGELRKEVGGQGDRLARLEERTEGRHQNSNRLLEEHGNRLARLEDRPSGQRRGLR